VSPVESVVSIGMSVDDAAIDARFSAARHALHTRNDRFFAKFMVVQWLATIVLAVVVSPRTWEGRIAATHLHVWAAIVLGGLITAYPVWLGLRRAGNPGTRQAIGIAQMLMSALLIHLTGGRIETHFHVFGSLAFLAFYRDVRVLVVATVVVYIDHLLRGIFWPESVYGVLVATASGALLRALEHAFWVLFELVFLAMSIRVGLKEMRQVVGRQIALERINTAKEQEVRERTQDLSASEERFRSFFRDAPIGLYRADAHGRFEAANPAMLALLGWPSIEALRADDAATAARRQDTGRGEFLRALTATGDVVTREASWLRLDGTPVHVRETARAFRDPAGQIVRIDGTVEDISERRSLEERYLQAQKVQAIGQLAGGVAHDFNNILTAINGYSELLLQGAPLDPGARRSAQQIRAASQRAANLTQQLLAFSRKQRLEPRELQLNAIVTEMDQMLQRLVGEHIRIRTVSQPGLAAVRADPGQIQQVVMNLVVNARDAMPNGGQLTIETANVSLDADYQRHHPDVPPGRYVLLAVSDSGVGITPEVKARLFEPFFTTKAPGTGTGLGLATCHGIIKQSDGHIAVYSEVGRGTTFKVYLPAIAMAAEPAKATVEVIDVRGAGEHVLLVEDDPSVRELGLHVLTTLGYQVTIATNGVEALQRFKQNPAVDVIVTDVVMPDMGGAELAQHVRAIAPRVRVLFTSGYTFDALGQTDLRGPNVAFLAKPYGTEQLGGAVRSLIRGVARPTGNSARPW
jgi:PAS domain S-box-containing protein